MVEGSGAIKVLQIFHFNNLFSRMASQADKLVFELKPGELLQVSDWKRHLLAASEKYQLGSFNGKRVKCPELVGLGSFFKKIEYVDLLC